MAPLAWNSGTEGSPWPDELPHSPGARAGRAYRAVLRVAGSSLGCLWGGSSGGQPGLGAQGPVSSALSTHTPFAGHLGEGVPPSEANR